MKQDLEINNIKVNIDNMIAIGGKEFGYNIYLQYKDKIDLNKLNIFEISNNIELAIPSFFTGFLHEFGLNDIHNHIKFIGGKNNCIESDYQTAMMEATIYNDI